MYRQYPLLFCIGNLKEVFEMDNKEREPPILQFIVPIAPTSKKNHQQILFNNKTRKPYVAPSKQYMEYENNALWFIPKDRNIDFPVNVKCLFYMPTKRPCDLTNMLESIDDVMVKARLLKDDNFNIIKGHDGSRVLYDKENPRTEVTIEKL